MAVNGLKLLAGALTLSMAYLLAKRWGNPSTKVAPIEPALQAIARPAAAPAPLSPREIASLQPAPAELEGFIRENFQVLQGSLSDLARKPVLVLVNDDETHEVANAILLNQLPLGDKDSIYLQGSERTAEDERWPRWNILDRIEPFVHLPLTKWWDHAFLQEHEVVELIWKSDDDLQFIENAQKVYSNQQGWTPQRLLDSEAQRKIALQSKFEAYREARELELSRYIDKALTKAGKGRGGWNIFLAKTEHVAPLLPRFIEREAPQLCLQLLPGRTQEDILRSQKRNFKHALPLYELTRESVDKWLLLDRNEQISQLLSLDRASLTDEERSVWKERVMHLLQPKTLTLKPPKVVVPPAQEVAHPPPMIGDDALVSNVHTFMLRYFVVLGGELSKRAIRQFLYASSVWVLGDIHNHLEHHSLNATLSNLVGDEHPVYIEGGKTSLKSSKKEYPQRGLLKHLKPEIAEKAQTWDLDLYNSEACINVFENISIRDNLKLVFQVKSLFALFRDEASWSIDRFNSYVQDNFDPSSFEEFCQERNISPNDFNSLKRVAIDYILQLNASKQRHRQVADSLQMKLEYLRDERLLAIVLEHRKKRQSHLILAGTEHVETLSSRLSKLSIPRTEYLCLVPRADLPLEIVQVEESFKLETPLDHEAQKKQLLALTVLDNSSNYHTLWAQRAVELLQNERGESAS